MNNIFFKIIFLSSIILFTIPSINAQTLNMQQIPDEKIKIGISFDKQFVKSNPKMSTLSGVYQISFNFPVSSRLNLIGNIPFINADYEITSNNFYYYYNAKGFGNIFIGLQTNPVNEGEKKSIISFGVFLPTAEETASLNGLLTNFYDIQKFTPNTYGMYFNYAYHKKSSDGLNYGLEIGPNFLIPTSKYGSITNIYIHYGLTAGYNFQQFLISTEFLGLAVLTGSANNFNDRLIHQWGLGAQWKGDVITPKIYYRIYLKDFLNDVIDGVLGIGITAAFN